MAKNKLVDSIELDSIDASELTPAERLALKQLQRMDAEDAEKERQTAQDKEARRRNALALQGQRNDQLLNQKYCSHKKENGHTNLAGQYDHQGTLHLICQRCIKEFVGQVPYDLQPKQINIGGPNR